MISIMLLGSESNNQLIMFNSRLSRLLEESRGLLICSHNIGIESQPVNRNHNRKLQTSKAPLKSQALGTSLFTSVASNQWGFSKNSPWEAQVRLPEGERMRQIRGVFQRIVLIIMCTNLFHGF